MQRSVITLLAAAASAANASTLGLSADGLRLALDGEEVFLNGINLAWVGYATDFNTSAAVGHGTYTYCMMRDAMRFVRKNGGNALRVWLFSDLVLGSPFAFDGASGQFLAQKDNTQCTFAEYTHPSAVYCTTHFSLYVSCCGVWVVHRSGERPASWRLRDAPYAPRHGARARCVHRPQPVERRPRARAEGSPKMLQQCCTHCHSVNLS